MSFELGLYTVIILVGPSQSGKSTWTRHFREHIQHIDKALRVNVLSSDDIRREILGQDMDRYAPEMLEASEAAFDLLFDKLKASMRFPINNEFIVIDSTGLDSQFRKGISELARAHAYRVALVMFDYPTGDYFEGLNGHEKTIVARHVDVFRKNVLPTIKRKHFDYSYSIKEKSARYFEDMQVHVQDYPLWKKSQLPELDLSRPIAFIGDVHEHVDALEKLLAKLPDNVQKIFIGDLIDKGHNVQAMMDYIESLDEKWIIKGNHESFVARRLRGELEAISNEEQNFSSLKVFQENTDLAQRFLKLFDTMLPFAHIKGYGKSIYATHAPCDIKSLGKLDEKNQKFQRNFYFSNREPQTMIEELAFMNQQAKATHPWHVFGHVAHSMKNPQIKNKVWLDTGAVYGGKLSAFVVFPGGNTKIVAHQTHRLSEGELLPVDKIGKVPVKTESVAPNDKQEKEVADTTIATQSDKVDFEKLLNEYKLEPEDKYWLHQFDESGACFISGTMAPARSSKKELEPIETALQYFKSQGIEEVIIEPKYMGSRLQMYLHRDRQKDFAVTRSGSKAGHHEEMKAVFDFWHQKLDSQDFWQDQVILDGELLPWSAIGRELIEKEFLQYGKSIEKELQLLASDEVFAQYAKDMNFYVQEHQQAIATFLQQLELYGEQRDMEYKPFTILAADGVSWVEKNQQEIFTALLPDEPCCVIKLTEENTHEKARQFFNSMTRSFEEQGLAHEGVVIKPVIYKSGVAPAMKVRNEKYLYLIYGYDYIFNYARMVEGKKINRKLELSIKEFELAQKMLACTNRQQKLELACQMKFEIQQEQELDIRL
jgi:predicted kinase